MTRIAILVLVCASLGACRDFGLQERPAPTLAVTPTAAFAGQALRVEAQGLSPSLANDSVFVGGRLARRIGRDGGALVVEMPLVEATCSRELPVQLGATGAAAGTVTYLGAGHPGRPRPGLLREVPVAFTPAQLRSDGVNLFASTFGTLMLAFDGQVQSPRAYHATDFVAAFEILRGSANGIFFAGRYGTFGTLGDDTRFGGVVAPHHAGDAPLVADAEAWLPSSVYDGETSVAAAPLAKAGIIEVDAVAVGSPGDAPPTRVRVQSDSAVAERLSQAHALVSYLGGARGRVVLAGGGSYLALRGGTAPAIQAFDWDGRGGDPMLLDPAGSGAALNPGAVRTAAGASAETVYVAAAWSGADAVATGPSEGSRPDAGGADPTAPDGGFDPAVDAGAPRGGGTSTPGGRVLLARVAVDGQGTRVEQIQWIELGAMRCEDLDLVFTGTAVNVFVVDGEQPLLWRYVVEDEGGLGTPKLAQVLPLARAGRRVAAAVTWQQKLSSTHVTVADVEGTLHRFELGATLEQRSATPVRLGGAAMAPLSGASCSDAPVLVAARNLESLVVAPLRGGGRPAFLAGGYGVQAVDSVAVTDPVTGIERSFYVAAGSEGVRIHEPIVQARQRGTTQTLALRFSFPARAVAVHPASREQAIVVAGGELGLAAIPIDAGLIGAPTPPEMQRYPECADVTSVVAAGERVLAVSGAEGVRSICSLNPRTGELARGAPLPAGWVPVGIAAALVDDPERPGTPKLHVLVAGARPRPAGGEELFVASVQFVEGRPDAIVELPLDGRIADRLPSRMAATSLGLSPDGRRLLLGFRGESPGAVAVDPVELLRLERMRTDPEATPEKVEQQAQACADGITAIALPAAPVGFSFSVDGARAAALLENDRVAVIE